MWLESCKAHPAKSYLKASSAWALSWAYWFKIALNMKDIKTSQHRRYPGLISPVNQPLPLLLLTHCASASTQKDPAPPSWRAKRRRRWDTGTPTHGWVTGPGPAQGCIPAARGWKTSILTRNRNQMGKEHEEAIKFLLLHSAVNYAQITGWLGDVTLPRAAPVGTDEVAEPSYPKPALPAASTSSSVCFFHPAVKSGCFSF